ncbi:hypothetical protein Tco_1277773 [Tanacetum coccineum]
MMSTLCSNWCAADEDVFIIRVFMGLGSGDLLYDEGSNAEEVYDHGVSFRRAKDFGLCFGSCCVNYLWNSCCALKSPWIWFSLI